MAKCVSCNKNVDDYVKFRCPKCGADIVRCSKCRSLELEYHCPKCDFEGV